MILSVYDRYYFICFMESTRDHDMEIKKTKGFVGFSPRFSHLKT